MPQRSTSFLTPLSRFVLEVLPWALSGLIGLYLAWGAWAAQPVAGAAARPPADWSAPEQAGDRPVSAHPAPALASQAM